MHNPNVSAQSKEHSRKVVEEIQGSGAVHDDGTTEPSSHSHAGSKDKNRVLGGYKATRGSDGVVLFFLLTSGIVSHLFRTCLQTLMMVQSKD
jgi:conidiation protein 6